MTLPAAQISIPEALAADLAEFPSDPFPGEASAVASGASGRRFFRIVRGEQTRVLMAYPAEPRENLLFTAIALALRAEKVPVPRILAENPERLLIWLEDLGERDLFSIRGQEAARSAYYEQAVDALVNLQTLPADLFSSREIETLPPFDADLYRFEQRYFQKELHDRLAPGIPIPPGLTEEMRNLEEHLLAAMPIWVHRDFQSKNLMIDPADQIRIVDFQGIRLGHRFYDLASLLCDPYVNLPAAERDRHFARFCKRTLRDPEQERPAYSAACCQRLMQALGAYGRFGLGGGIEFFRAKIPVALDLLHTHAEESGLTTLAQLAADLKKLELPSPTQVAEEKPVPTA
ncbi:MAG: aminoglycoside phosphotransferase family protein [Puniceicoccales bacterium]